MSRDPHSHEHLYSEYSDQIEKPLSAIEAGESQDEIVDLLIAEEADRLTAEKAAALLAERLERKDPYAELGGHAVALTESQEDAIVGAGLGNNGMRLRVAKRRQDEADRRQQEVNRTGAALTREAKIASDAAQGVDTESAEYLAALQLADEKRNRRS